MYGWEMCSCAYQLVFRSAMQSTISVWLIDDIANEVHFKENSIFSVSSILHIDLQGNSTVFLYGDYNVHVQRVSDLSSGWG